MKNSTNIKIPKKYQHMIDEICIISDEYCVFASEGFYFADIALEYKLDKKDSTSANERTQKDLLKVIRSLKPLNS